MEYFCFGKGIVYCIVMQIGITSEFEVSYNGKGQGTKDFSIGLEIEPIEGIGLMSAILD